MCTRGDVCGMWGVCEQGGGASLPVGCVGVWTWACPCPSLGLPQGEEGGAVAEGRRWGLGAAGFQMACIISFTSSRIFHIFNFSVLSMYYLYNINALFQGIKGWGDSRGPVGPGELGKHVGAPSSAWPRGCLWTPEPLASLGGTPSVPLGSLGLSPAHPAHH